MVVYALISIYLSTYLSIDRSIDLSIYRSIYRSIYLSICLSIYPSIHPSIYLSIHPSIHPSIYIHLSMHLPICLSFYLYIYILCDYTFSCMCASARRTPPYFSLLLCFGGHLLVLSFLCSLANLCAQSCFHLLPSLPRLSPHIFTKVLHNGGSFFRRIHGVMCVM